MTSERHPLLGMTKIAWALIVMIVIAAAMSGVALTLLLRDRDVARDQRDLVTGQSQQLVDCVNDPGAADCAAEADKVEETIDGLPGATGAQGPQGVQGIQGVPGVTLQGPRGFIGPIGPRGIPGRVGIDGDTGATGNAGATGDQGAQGAAGESGPQGSEGPAGQPGRDGTDGRDGTAQVGSYSCPDAQYVAGFTVGDAGFVTLDCRAVPTPEPPPAA